MATVKELQRLLSYFPPDYEVGIGDVWSEAFDHTFLGVFDPEHRFIADIDLDFGDIQAAYPFKLEYHTNRDGSIQPQGYRVMTKEERKEAGTLQ
jgi:hypothetical protein